MINSRSDYFYFVLTTLYEQRRLRETRVLHKANPDGIKLHLHHLVNRNVIPQSWVNAVTAPCEERPGELLRQLDAILPLQHC